MALRPVLTYARERGFDVEPLLAELGLAPAILDDIDHRIPEADRSRAWGAAAAGLRDPYLALGFAASVPMGAFDALDYAVSCSPTWGAAIERVLRFHRVLCDAWAVTREVDGETVRLRRIANSSVAVEAEAFPAVLVARGRELTGMRLVPHEVCFAHTFAAEPAPYEAFFGCPVRQGCAAMELVFRAVDLDTPVRGANPGLNRVLDRYLTDLLERVGHDDPFVEQVRRSVGRAMKEGARPTLEIVTKELHVPPRTIQRRLREHGTSYAALVETVRRALGERLVADGRVSLTEIAFLLGFADLSGFRRAYRSWTGRSPSRGRSHPERVRT